MVYADLHAHTTRSDGEMEPDEVADVARDAGVSVVAVTDHDRVPPFSGVVSRDEITLIAGIELRVETDDERVDLLGYGVESTDALERECERLQQDRMDRGRRIVECVEDYCGVSLDIELTDNIGRPHIARAIDAHPDIDVDYRGAFAELIGDDCPCYVSRDVTQFERGRDLLDEAAAVVGLAHPFRYDDPAAALALTDRLDAVELHYPYGFETDDAPIRDAVAANDLLATGGTDAHEHELGVAGLSRDQFEPVADALGIDRAVLPPGA
ncbi:PHP domain-containing protein [Halobacteriales archaeon SW_7_68_16]|nr:MAG: PHP domain-containing protein [Halobacteriales archaeon SW_7_68_16]